MDAIIDISTVVWVFVALVGVLVALRLAFRIYKRFRARKLRLLKGLDPPPIRGGEPPNLGAAPAARMRQAPVGTYTDTDSPERIRCDMCGKLGVLRRDPGGRNGQVSAQSIHIPQSLLRTALWKLASYEAAIEMVARRSSGKGLHAT